MIRHRHRKFSLYSPKKRSRLEYQKVKVRGRVRDRFKLTRARCCSWKKDSQRRQNRSKTITVKMNTRNITSKLQCHNYRFISLKKTRKTNVQFESKRRRASLLTFSLLAAINYVSECNKNVWIRFYNQQLYIYSKSSGARRSSRKDRICTLSTLSGTRT